MGDGLGARAFLQRYRTSNKDSAGVLYLCAIIEEELGDERARADCVTRLLEDFPRLAEAKNLTGQGTS